MHTIWKCNFSERELRYVRYMLSQFRLSVVCDVGAPYSAG